MNWRRLRNALVNEHHEEPQTIAMIDHALRLTEEGLSLLSRLGHHMHLAAGTEPESRGYPKLMFHMEAAPRGHLVFCQEDIDWLGEGWFETLDEAKHAAGMGQQFRRGGIFPKRGLPAIVRESSRETDEEKI